MEGIAMTPEQRAIEALRPLVDEARRQGRIIGLEIAYRITGDAKLLDLIRAEKVTK